MKYYTESARQLPVEGEFDVIVAGSGPAGASAAVMAGRLEAKVLIIEWNNSVSGMSTSGLMSHWTGTVSSPLYSEILSRCAAYCEGDDRGRIVPWIDPEILKTVWIEMLRDAGVTVLLYTFVCGVVTEGDRVVGVVTESKSGRRGFLSKITVDGTGDGDVAAFAGVKYYKGRESDGKTQPCTLMFKAAGVDTDRAVLPGSFESKHRTEKGELQDGDLCKWCGKPHEGFFGKILGFFHSILWFFAHLFGRR
ncbi:MAG: FAD-dependent oxidoreductase [Clostridia bacterium]|nr:FAD-dependent oxidoreductase [Clostridia bacterium]